MSVETLRQFFPILPEEIPSPLFKHKSIFDDRSYLSDLSNLSISIV